MGASKSSAILILPLRMPKWRGLFFEKAISLTIGFPDFEMTISFPRDAAATNFEN
jgi:hypothetical protein